MKTYVLYHASCYDGLGAAYAAWKRFGEKAEYIPVAYGKDLPNMELGSDIYIVDFSYPPTTIRNLAQKHKSVTVLDHHKSAMEQWAGEGFIGTNFYTDDFIDTETNEDNNINIYFDMNLSGAGIAWDYLVWNPMIKGQDERPAFIDLIEDRDLWKFNDPRSKAFHSYLLSIPQDFRNYAQFENPDYLNDAIRQGEALLRMTNQIVENICKNAYVHTTFMGHSVAIVNTSSHWSEVGNLLLEKFPNADFAAAYTDLPNNVRQFSLRSKAPFDVAKIAKTYGGGGHAQAAGFKINLTSQIDDFTKMNVQAKG